MFDFNDKEFIEMRLGEVFQRVFHEEIPNILDNDLPDYISDEIVSMKEFPNKANEKEEEKYSKDLEMVKNFLDDTDPEETTKSSGEIWYPSDVLSNYLMDEDIYYDLTKDIEQGNLQHMMLCEIVSDRSCLKKYADYLIEQMYELGLDEFYHPDMMNKTKGAKK